jgi:hypothetical protein
MHPDTLYRQTDGEAFSKNFDGTYSMRDSRMASPFKYSYRMLMNTNSFGNEPPTTIEQPAKVKKGCGYEDED